MCSSRKCVPASGFPAYVLVGYYYGELHHICLLRPPLRSLQACQGFVRNYGQLLGEIHHINVCPVHDALSRLEISAGVIRGRIVPWCQSLPLMVCCSHRLQLELSPPLVGTNARNSVSAPQFSFLRPRCRVHSAVCWLHVKSVTCRELQLTLYSKAGISNMDGVGGKYG